MFKQENIVQVQGTYTHATKTQTLVHLYSGRPTGKESQLGLQKIQFSPQPVLIQAVGINRTRRMARSTSKGQSKVADHIGLLVLGTGCEKRKHKTYNFWHECPILTIRLAILPPEKSKIVCFPCNNSSTKTQGNLI